MKILVVDDDQDMRDFYVEALDWHEVICVSDGRQGVNEYLDGEGSGGERYDLVIMDGQMPVLGGYDAAEEILSYDADAKIILLSWAPDHARAKDINFVGVHSKTLEQTVIRQLVCQYADESCGEPAASDDLDEPVAEDSGEPTPASPEDTGDPEAYDIVLSEADVLDIAAEDEEPKETYAEKQARERAEQRAEVIAGIREFCDLLEQHDDLPMPYAFTNEVTIYLTGEGKETLPKMTSIRRLIGGKWEKKPWADYFDLVGKVRGVTVKLTASRKDVCQRVVTGTRTSVVEVPDPELVAQVPLKRVETTIEDVEWVCPESLVSG